MTTQERISQVEQAQDLIMEAQRMIDEAVSGTPIQDNFEAYGRYGIDQLLGNGNPYDNSLQTLFQCFDEDLDTLWFNQ